MGYEVAVQKAWAGLEALDAGKIFVVTFLGVEHTIDIGDKSVFSLSYNAQAKEWAAVLILHYLIQKLKFLPPVTGEWISFKELPGGEIYFPAFRTRDIDQVIRKYGKNPEGLFSALQRLPGRKVKQADAAVVLDVFENVPVLIELWSGNEEFGPEANILFDRNIGHIFCTEDVVVLSSFVAKQL